MNFNPYSRSYLGNLRPVYAQLCEERPVHLKERPRFWAISRLADVYRRYATGPRSHQARATLDGLTGINPMIITMDPPRDAALRKTLPSAFAAEANHDAGKVDPANCTLSDGRRRRGFRGRPGRAVHRPVADHGDSRHARHRPADRDLFKTWSNRIMATAAGARVPVTQLRRNPLSPKDRRRPSCAAPTAHRANLDNATGFDAMSAANAGAPVPSTTVPPRITKSCMCA